MSGYGKETDHRKQSFALKYKNQTSVFTNLQTKRYFLAEEDKWVTLKVSSEAIRTINKNGLYSVVKELRAAGEKI